MSRSVRHVFAVSVVAGFADFADGGSNGVGIVARRRLHQRVDRQLQCLTQAFEVREFVSGFRLHAAVGDFARALRVSLRGESFRPLKVASPVFDRRRVKGLFTTRDFGKQAHMPAHDAVGPLTKIDPVVTALRMGRRRPRGAGEGEGDRVAQESS